MNSGKLSWDPIFDTIFDDPPGGDDDDDFDIDAWC